MQLRITFLGILLVAFGAAAFARGCAGESDHDNNDGHHDDAGTQDDDGDDGGEVADVAAYYCPMHVDVTSNDADEPCSKCGMALEAREDSDGGTDDARADVATYYCPMHPDVTSNDADERCSKCGMALEAREDSDGGADDDHGDHDNGMGDGNADAGMFANPEAGICMVSGKAIDADKVVEYDGKRYAFCCGNCIAKFNANPDEYLVASDGGAAGEDDQGDDHHDGG